VVSGSSRWSSASTKPGWHITTLPLGSSKRNLKNLGIVRVLREAVRPGEGRIHPHAIPIGEAAETGAQYVEGDCLWVS
jgi:hypothetical protein